MGWTSYMARNYKPNGKVDVKAELDRMYDYKDEKKEMRVLKSGIKNGIYYAAVEVFNVVYQEREVICAVVKYSTSPCDGMNFAYKPMDESMNPYFYDCPKKVFELLTPTTNEWANEWRRKVREYREIPKLKDLPVGTLIKWRDVILEKMPPRYQFKTNWWYCHNNGCYVPKTRIKENWEVIEDETLYCNG